MRLPSGNWRFGDDPLLKAGIVLMSLALAFAAVVAVVALLDEPMERAVAAKSASKPSVEPLVRSYPQVAKVEPRPVSKPQEPKPQEPRPEPRPEPRAKSASKPEPEPDPLPLAEADPPMPTGEEIEAANGPRHYDLPPGAIMGLTIDALQIYNVPVFDSDRQWALSQGVGHVPETSLPWSNTPQRNVYLAGHRLGYPGTGSRLVFYNLDALRKGDKILLRDRRGRKYEYLVSEAFIADPVDSWVMGQVRGRDMVTLQTCTPIPTYEKRLIVRADRV